MTRRHALVAAAVFCLTLAVLARWDAPLPASYRLLAGMFGSEASPVLFASPAGDRKLMYDLDGDGVQEEYSLQADSLLVRNADGVIWQTPPEWQVTECLIGDVTGDGVPDLLLSVWKKGSFGSHKPFWVSGEDETFRNHLFVFNLAHGAVKVVWQSSNLSRPNHAVFLSDLDGDGRSELIALEGLYDNPKAIRVTVWQWNGWGFSRQQ